MVSSQGYPTLKLSVPEILASVRSLYADELKPFGRVLLKRLRERAARSAAIAHGYPVEAVDPESMPKIDPKRLRRLCQTCPQIHVHPEEGREFSVTLKGQICSFLDVCSPHDPYPQEMWLDAASYFQHLSWEELYMPGGRYACARELVRRGLPFLAGCSLGQVCHIIQLAISQKRILGYLEGQLVPYQHSEEWIKEQYAFHQQPICSKPGIQSLPVATWEEARERLWELLTSESNPEPGVLTLSNVKRLFRARFQLELSETVLGHSRLFDLLRDVRFRDVCVLQAHKNGQLLVKRAEGPQHLSHQSMEPQGSLSMPSYEALTDIYSEAHMLSQTNTLLPPQSMLHGHSDLCVESCWQGLSTGVSSWRDNSADFFFRGLDEESSQSTELPQLREICCSASSDGDSEQSHPSSPLQAQALALLAEEEESIAALNEQTQIAHMQNERRVKNTFIHIPASSSHGNAKRRLRSVPKDLAFCYSF